jgi:hypothetical protein
MTIGSKKVSPIENSTPAKADDDPDRNAGNGGIRARLDVIAVADGAADHAL